MIRNFLKPNILLLGLTLLASCASSQIVAPPEQVDKRNRDAIERYYDASRRLDMEGISAELHIDFELVDRTFEVLSGSGIHISGLESFREYYAPLLDYADHNDIEINFLLATGDHAVAGTTSVVVTDGQQAGHPELESLPITYRAISLFRLEGGKIRKIEDVVDYESVKQSLLAPLADGRSEFSGELPSTPPFPYAEHRTLVIDYLEGMIALSADKLVAGLADDITVTDHMITKYLGEPRILSGTDAVRAFFESNASAAGTARYELHDEIFAANTAAIRVNMWVSTRLSQLGLEGDTFAEIHYPSVYVFSFDKGKISAIDGYIDYDSVQAQIDALARKQLN